MQLLAVVWHQYERRHLDELEMGTQEAFSFYISHWFWVWKLKSKSCLLDYSKNHTMKEGLFLSTLNKNRLLSSSRRSWNFWQKDECIPRLLMSLSVQKEQNVKLWCWGRVPIQHDLWMEGVIITCDLSVRFIIYAIPKAKNSKDLSFMMFIRFHVELHIL